MKVPTEDVPSLEGNARAVTESLGVLVFSSVSSEDLCAASGKLMQLRLGTQVCISTPG